MCGYTLNRQCLNYPLITVVDRTNHHEILEDEFHWLVPIEDRRERDRSLLAVFTKPFGKFVCVYFRTRELNVDRICLLI
jgi:hypothetical protein